MESTQSTIAAKKINHSYGMALIIVTAILTCLGLLAIYAASAMKGAEQFGDPYLFIRKQSIVACVGFVSILFLQFIPLKLIDKLALPSLVLSLFLLALIFIPGAYLKVGGASRWLGVSGLRFQTSELAKVALVLFLAKNLSRYSCNVQRMGLGVISNIFIFSCFAFLMMMQPDFGSTVLLGGITFLMLYISGLSKKLILSSFFIALIGLAGAIAAAPYRLKRLLSFLDPWSEVSGGGFQIIQSYLGFQNGGLLGVGLGESRQKLFFLPEAHTDFILSVIGEELGLLGVSLVCGLYFLLVWLGFKIAAKQKNMFYSLIGYGFTCLIGLQSALNMGVVMGILPTKGIPLPFVSHGSSSLIVFLTIIGILARLDRAGTLKGANSPHVFV
ncbi:MAG: putative lipid II flippase FtsW [Bdellovibrionota bacterium]